jgi:hypothetical protein
MNLALIKRIGLWFATIFVLPMTVIPPVQAQQNQPNIFASLSQCARECPRRGAPAGVCAAS